MRAMLRQRGFLLRCGREPITVCHTINPACAGPVEPVRVPGPVAGRCRAADIEHGSVPWWHFPEARRQAPGASAPGLPRPEGQGSRPATRSTFHLKLLPGQRARAYAATGDPLGEDPARPYLPGAAIPEPAHGLP